MSENRNCPNCGAPYDLNLNKCAYCGTSYFDLIDIVKRNKKTSQQNKVIYYDVPCGAKGNIVTFPIATGNCVRNHAGVTATGNYVRNHAEGIGTKASGSCSHAVRYESKTTEINSHAKDSCIKKLTNYLKKIFKGKM